MSYPSRMSVTLTYTPPADIEGEPEDVRELSLQQLGEALAQVIQLAGETTTQLRAEGVGRIGESWVFGPEGRAALDLLSGLGQATDELKRLQQAV
jgi:hypothetical protein